MMPMRRFLALVVLAGAACPALAENFDLGELAVPSETHFGNWFNSAGSKTDNYTFTITELAQASGLVAEVDPWWNWTNIDVRSVTLLGVGTYAATGPISFGVLQAGTYTLRIVSEVSWTLGLPLVPAGYEGTLKLRDVRAGGPATSVPEPDVVLLYGLGLLGVALAARRRSAAGAEG